VNVIPDAYGGHFPVGALRLRHPTLLLIRKCVSAEPYS
jgi:hypothetical protein